MSVSASVPFRISRLVSNATIARGIRTCCACACARVHSQGHNDEIVERRA